MSEIDATLVKDGQKVVATVSQSGTIISDPSAVDATALVQTDNGPQLCVKTFEMGEGGGGGGDVPDNVYTQDNLVAGTNVSITRVPQPVYDENTLGVWHLDDETGANAITTGAYAQTTLFTESHVHTTSFSKFGTGSCLINTTKVLSSAALLLNINSTLASSNFTLDMWVRTPTGNNQNYKLTIIFGMSTELYIYLANNRIQIGSNQTSTTAGTWHHLAMERYNNTLNGYVDGTLIYTASTSQTASFNIKVTNENQSYIPGSCLDEVRLSNVARYQGQNFTPFDVAYSATLPPKYQINNTQDLSAYLQNTATGTDALTILGTATSSQYAMSIGASATANQNDAHAIGRGATASGLGALAIGGGAVASGYQSVGIKANATAYGALAIGGGGINPAYASANNAIQIGSGTNSTATTFQVFTFKLLDGTTGLIPAERIGTGYDATKTQVLKNVNGTLTWVDE